jgi:riboflavin kinase / FMN adenylyltransferase
VGNIVRADERFDHSFFEGSSCAMGVFDGLHRGHQYILSCARKRAEETGAKSIALTFDKDPDEIFHSERLKKLMSNDDRIVALSQSGVSDVVVLPFTKEFASQGPEGFLLSLFNGFTPKYLHVGSDFRFGARAKGTIDELDTWGNNHGTNIRSHHLREKDGAPITSTRIRGLLKKGNIEKANELLGHPYIIHEQVQVGYGEGKNLGFRTANLKLDVSMQVLADGVYAGYALLGSERYKAAISVGQPRVFDRLDPATCEVHLLDFEEDLYGTSIKVEFLNFLRPMMKFSSPEELAATVKQNIAWVKDNL